jgi:signal transduction histidine kinase
LELLRQGEVDLALLEQSVSGMEGLAILKEGCKSPEPVPIIFCTTRADIPAVVAAIKAGAEDYLVRPVPTDQLRQALQTALHNRPDRRAARVASAVDRKLGPSAHLEIVGRTAIKVAHDLSNQMAVMLGHSEEVLRGLGDDDSLRGPLEKIHLAAQWAAELSKQLMWSIHKPEPTPQLLNVNALLTGMSKLLQLFVGERIDVLISLDPCSGEVWADPVQLKRVIMNLTINARHAMPRGGKLTLTTAPVILDHALPDSAGPPYPPTHVLLTVNDNGRGMDEATVKELRRGHLSTTKNGEQGHGLGVLISREIIEQSGGEMEVSSKLGQGTTFAIHLPRIPETILLVDDNAEFRSLLREVLRRNRYTVLPASDYEDALRLEEQCKGPIHLLLTDMMMPEMNGPELAARLSVLRPGIKVLYISGYPPSDPSAPFLQKPFSDNNALVRKVREVLDRRPTAPIPGC